MAKVRIDKFYCLLNILHNDTQAVRVICYMYLYQMAGFKTHFKFKITSTGLKSDDVTGFLNSLIGNGLITSKNGLLHYEGNIDEDLLEYDIKAERKSYLKNITEYADNLNLNELKLICVTDMVMQDFLKKDSLADMDKPSCRNEIKRIVQNLNPDISSDDFDIIFNIIKTMKCYNFSVDKLNNLRVETKLLHSLTESFEGIEQNVG